MQYIPLMFQWIGFMKWGRTGGAWNIFVCILRILRTQAASGPWWLAAAAEARRTVHSHSEHTEELRRISWDSPQQHEGRTSMDDIMPRLSESQAHQAPAMSLPWSRKSGSHETLSLHMSIRCLLRLNAAAGRKKSGVTSVNGLHQQGTWWPTLVKGAAEWAVWSAGGQLARSGTLAVFALPLSLWLASF